MYIKTKIPNMYVSDNLISDNKDNVHIFTKNDFKTFINSLKKCRKNKNGSSSKIFFKDDKAIKIYKSEPLLYEWDDEDIVADGTNVVTNLFNLLEVNHESALSPNMLYVVDGILLGYESNNSNMPLMSSYNLVEEISLPMLKLAWENAYDLADYFTSRNIFMDDVTTYNSFLDKGMFKICDLDFFEKRESLDKEDNIECINELFNYFVKKYVFRGNRKYFDSLYDEDLIKTKYYLDHEFDIIESYDIKRINPIIKPYRGM